MDGLSFQLPQQPAMMFINNDIGSMVLGDTISMEMERVLFMDENGIIREAYPDLCSVILSNAEEEMEIPSFVLDHPYAKKPRSGSEQTTTKPRRKSKRKEQIVEQFVITDPQPETPKINIIRQHLPRPKILQGAQQAGKGGRGASLNNSPKGKITVKKDAGRSNNKKEDPFNQPMYMPFDDNGCKNTQQKSTGKYGKDTLAKSLKSSTPKSNTANNSAIMMEELQSRPDGATGYEEEMLFDFGITEDDDEVNGLGSEEFSDVVFDECEFETGLEVYNTSLSRSPVTSVIQLNQRPSIKTSLNINSVQSSDEDDTDQIMVSMTNRRPSQDSMDSMTTEDECKPDVDISKDDQDIKSNVEISEDSNALPSQSPPQTETNTLKQTISTPSPTRRSKRSVKVPSWLEDSADIGKRKRR